jgi:hypothetical protein
LPAKKEKEDKQHFQELKEMLNEAKQPKEEVLAIFCNRHGISMTQCKEYYDKLVAQGQVKEK